MSNPISPLQKRAYQLGLLAAAVTAILMFLPLGKGWQQPGPDNIGHETMECEACHADANGGIVASVQHWLDPQADEAWFGTRPVGNSQCLDCHLNETDRHPVERFVKPEFELARQAISPESCVSCHAQHQANRATVDLDFCQHCHQDMQVEEDPIDVPHAELATDARWDTCLGCHDFHGNHDGETPLQMARIHSESQVLDYLNGGPSPYGYRKLTVMQTMQVKQE